MTADRELMQMALDALSNFDKGNHGMRWQVPVIKALRIRLAQPEPAECDGGQCGIGGYCKQCPKTQPEPEPVAWGFQNTGITGSNRWMYLRETIPAEDQYRGILWTPLYTAPPQREWQGMTDENIFSLLVNLQEMYVRPPTTDSRFIFARAIEAKLKEKNT